jgi:hypothetical protein
MRIALLFIVLRCLAQQPAPKPQAPKQKKETAQTARTFLIWLARVSGLSATSSGLKGEDEIRQGDVWTEPIAEGARQRLTFEGGYSWPVFSSTGESAIALRGGDLWSIPIGGGSPAKFAHTLSGIVSLLGDGPEGIVMLTADKIGTFSPSTGVFSPFPAKSKEDLDEINRLRLPERSYANSQITVTGFEGVIRIVNRGQEREIAPGKAKVWQPSVANDGKRLVYIRVDDSNR